MTLPRGWIEAPLLDLVDLHDTRRVPLNQAERAARPGTYPYFGANGQVDTVGDYLFDGDYILLAEDGGYFDQPARGVSYEASGRFWVNNHAHILSSRGGIPHGFLNRLFNQIDWMPYVSGTTRLKLTQGGMERLSVPLPPISEQIRIVARLNVLSDQLRHIRINVDRVRVLAEKFRIRTLSEAFAESVTSQWPRYKIGMLLSEGQIGMVRSKDEQGASGVPYIRMNHFNSIGTWNTEKLTKVICNVAEVEKYELRSGDVLFNTRNSVELVGKLALWPEGREQHVYNNNLLRMRFSESITPQFFFWLMSSPALKGEIQKLKSGTTSVAAIYQRDLYDLDIPVPPLDQQWAAVGLIQGAFGRADRFESEAVRSAKLLDRLERCILARAFRGELVPHDPADEPASALLDRIRAERAAGPKAKRGRSAAPAVND